MGLAAHGDFGDDPAAQEGLAGLAHGLGGGLRVGFGFRFGHRFRVGYRFRRSAAFADEDHLHTLLLGDQGAVLSRDQRDAVQQGRAVGNGPGRLAGGAVGVAHQGGAVGVEGDAHVHAELGGGVGLAAHGDFGDGPAAQEGLASLTHGLGRHGRDHGLGCRGGDGVCGVACQQGVDVGQFGGCAVAGPEFHGHGGVGAPQGGVLRRLFDGRVVGILGQAHGQHPGAAGDDAVLGEGGQVGGLEAHQRQVRALVGDGHVVLGHAVGDVQLGEVFAVGEGCAAEGGRVHDE